MRSAGPADHVPADYRSAGVDYAALDAGKRRALEAALATSGLLSAHGGRALDASRGEPAFVFELAGRSFALVLEGLGTKSIIARLVAEQLGENHFDQVAYDTVAAIVNDLSCVGALPLVLTAYFATGSSAWYGQDERQRALLEGWRRGCQDAGATWGGGESPSLPDLVAERELELAGSAVGVVPDGRDPILGQDLAPGDEIVLIASSGLHANGASLARMIAARPQLPDGYATRLQSGRTLGRALLEPTIIYVPLVRRLLAQELPIHYLSHITGHGWLKLMRAQRELTYRVSELPAVPEVLRFLVEQAELSEQAAYSTFNMGCGYAVYCAEGAGAEVVALAGELGLSAQVAGRVERGPRRLIIEPLGLSYESEALALAPARRG